MKKVLIITYVFKNREDIGSVRLHGLANYLPEYGWEPVILTTKVKTDDKFEFRVIETPFEDIYTKWKKMLGLNPNCTFKEQFNLPALKNKKTLIDYLLKLWDEIFTYPDRGKGWYKYALETGNELLEKEQFDAMLSSSPPHISHLIANNLIKKIKVPWVADFRDLWTLWHYYQYSSLRRFFETKLEIKTVKLADAITTVSEPLATKLGKLHNREVYVIHNGFDPKLKNPGTELSDNFNIVYTGHIYTGKQDPEPLFKALYELRSENCIGNNDMVVDFYGCHYDWLYSDIKKYNLQNVINIHGMIPRDEAQSKQREAHVLLILNWNDSKETGIYTGKLFEYLAAQRPILSIGYNGGVVEELLNETGAGIHASTVDELKNVILTFYREYKKTGTVSYKGVDTKIDKYNHREMAKKFAFVLDDVVKNNT